MSTTDVAGSVVPVYTPTLPVTNDASILTQADLTALTLSLANRIEFIRQSVALASESFCAVKEDFLHVDPDPVTFGSPREWFGDTPWRIVQQSAGTLALSYEDIGNTVHHGTITIMSTSGTTGAVWYKDNPVGGRGVRFSTLLRAVCILTIRSTAAPLKFEFGLKAGSSPAIDQANAASVTFLFNPAVNANWLAKTSLNAAASAHYSDTGVPPSAPGVMQKLEILRTSTSPLTFDFLINGTVVATKIQSGVLTPFVPSSDNGHMAFGGIVPVVTVADETIDIDWVSFELNSSGR